MTSRRATRWARWRARLGVLVLLAPLLAGCGAGPTDEGKWPEEPEPPIKSLVWPLANTGDVDADSVHAPFGPRALPGGYDFHAGIDLPAPIGTPVNAVLPGRVILVSRWDGSSTGPGNAVLVAHSDDRSTSYLHLESISVAEGDSVEAGEKVGTAGRTGASYAHLHLGYFVGLPRSTRTRDERRSRNPLEVLPHTPLDDVPVTFQGESVVLDLPLQQMTLQTLELSGAGTTRRVSYYDIVARGSSARDEQLQDGIHLDASRPAGGRFDLTLTPSPGTFSPERVTALDFNGDTLFVAVR